MKRLTSLVVASVAGLTACEAFATPRAVQANAPDMTFVQTFMGNCAMNFPDTDRIASAAIAFKWDRITDAATLKTIGPVDNGGKWKAWRFKNGGKGFLLAAGSRLMKAKHVDFCVLIAEPASIDATRNQIAVLLRAKPEEKEVYQGQNYFTYSVKGEDGARTLNFIDARPMGMKTMNASMMTDPY